MRSWNNTIKRYLITLACEPYIFNKIHNDNQKSVVVIPKKILDFGVGRGGDLSKYNDSCVELMVGIDIDRNGFEGEDGAISRYRKIQQKTYKRFPILECEDKVPFKFILGKGIVIKGWDIGLKDMNIDEKRCLVIPSQFAYGNRKIGNIIKPNSTLIFEVKLLNIIKTQ